MSGELVAGLYLSTLAFWATIGMVSIGVLSMLIPLMKNKKQKRVIIYFFSFGIIILTGSFSAFYEFFFLTLGVYNLFFLFLLILLIIIVSILVIFKKEFVNLPLFTNLGFAFVLMMGILVLEIVVDQVLLFWRSLIFLFAAISFYLALFSSLCKIFCKADLRLIFKRKIKTRKRLEDVI